MWEILLPSGKEGGCQLLTANNSPRRNQIEIEEKAINLILPPVLRGLQGGREPFIQV
jgi:hypothetical protein